MSFWSKVKSFLFEPQPAPAAPAPPPAPPAPVHQAVSQPAKAVIRERRKQVVKKLRAPKTSAVIIKKRKGAPDVVEVVQGKAQAQAKSEAESQAVAERKVMRQQFRLQPKPPRISPRAPRLL